MATVEKTGQVKEGILVVISSPSGGGKSTIVKRLREQHPAYRYSVSVTTRSRRAGETDGRHYSFVTPEEFRRRIDGGYFAEWAQVHGHYYGTPRSFVDRVLTGGEIALFDLDVQGGLQIKEAYPQAVLVFVLPPSPQELERRLRGRKTDDEDVIQTRLENAKSEVTYWPQYDYVVVNDSLEDAVASVQAIITAERCRSGRAQITYGG
jgi:guanylate kinase